MHSTVEAAQTLKRIEKTLIKIERKLGKR